MEIVKPLLELYEAGADEEPDHVFDVVMFCAELFRFIILERPKHGGLQQLDLPAIGFARDEADDGTGERIFRTDPIGDVFAVVVVVRAGEPAFDEVQIIANGILMYQDVAFLQVMSFQYAGQGQAAFGRKGAELGDDFKKFFHDIRSKLLARPDAR